MQPESSNIVPSPEKDAQTPLRLLTEQNESHPEEAPEVWANRIAANILQAWRAKGMRKKVTIQQISAALTGRCELVMGYDATEERAREIAAERIQEMGPNDL